MGKILKLSGLVLTIFSLVACQAEDKMVALEEKDAISHLKKIKNKIGKNLPNELTIVNYLNESSECYGDFVSQFGTTSETYSESTTLTFNLKEHYFSQKHETTLKMVDYGSTEERTVQYHKYAYYEYFKDNLKYSVTSSYSWSQVNVPNPSIEEFKIYTTKNVTKSEFDNDLKESYLTYLTVNQDTDADEFFAHMGEHMFLNQSPAKDLSIPKTNDTTIFAKDKETLIYSSLEDRTIQLEDMDNSKLLQEDKNVVNHVNYASYVDFKLANNYYTQLITSCSSFFKDSEDKTYKLEKYSYRVNTYNKADIEYVDLTDYSKK